MNPLMVTAKLIGPVVLDRPIALDGLLAWAVATRDQITPAHTDEEIVPIDIPVVMEPEGRFHLCSTSIVEIEQRETRWMNRRPVIAEAQALGTFKRMQINAGPSKGYRVPIEAVHLKSDEVRWFLIGDIRPVKELLGLVSHLGRRRGVGLGRVREWTVNECEPWDDGFPVVLDGAPLRPLPTDWPGLVDPSLGYSTLTYPYWRRYAEELLAVPVM